MFKLFNVFSLVFKDVAATFENTLLCTCYAMQLSSIPFDSSNVYLHHIHGLSLYKSCALNN